MNLNYNKLIQFDLLHDLDVKMSEEEFKTRFWDFFDVCQEIINTDRFIRDCPSFPGSNKNIIRDELVMAIGSTLAIEGITLKEEEIKETIQKDGLPDTLQRKQKEVLNSVRVYDYVKDVVNACKGDFVYQEDHIKRIHELFTEGIEYIGNFPGRYRTVKALFGEPRKISFCETEGEIRVAMLNFIKWLNLQENNKHSLEYNPFAKAIMAHYYLTEIHPFADGNGRTARAVEAMVLYANRINPYCFWSLANFWSADRNKYIFSLGNIRSNCDPFDLIIWGAKGYLEEVKRVKEKVLKKLKCLMLRDYVRWLLKTKKQQKPKDRINERILNLILLLTDSGKIPIEKFRASSEYESLYAHKSSGATKTRDIGKMRSLELIRITEGDDKKTFIEPNYEVLAKLSYRVS